MLQLTIMQDSLRYGALAKPPNPPTDGISAPPIAPMHTLLGFLGKRPLRTYQLQGVGELKLLLGAWYGVFKVYRLRGLSAFQSHCPGLGRTADRRARLVPQDCKQSVTFACLASAASSAVTQIVVEGFASRRRAQSATCVDPHWRVT